MTEKRLSPLVLPSETGTIYLYYWGFLLPVKWGGRSPPALGYSAGLQNTEVCSSDHPRSHSCFRGKDKGEPGPPRFSDPTLSVCGCGITLI